ncbi:hypothetical protein FA13DRAFT_1708380 [Coprinellus micaceus]|uniref:Uncharacterized protein n=1 Tax=Coprinellus micaceus TaxID=71717 RepID=A0A4Y7TJF2_COPMI|nr:hypothetical protein FA13DRAFT_1708380 [Coprinellus micaceus]
MTSLRSTTLPACEYLFITLNVKTRDDLRQDMGDLVGRYTLPFVSEDAEITIFDCPASPAFTVAFARSNPSRKEDPRIEVSTSGPSLAQAQLWWKHNLVIVLKMKYRHVIQAAQYAAFLWTWKPAIREVSNVVYSPETPYGGGAQQPPASTPRGYLCSIFDFLTSESSKSLNLVCKSSFAEQLKRSYHLQEKGEGLVEVRGREALPSLAAAFDLGCSPSDPDACPKAEP